MLMEVISRYVDFELFRPELERGLQRDERKSNAGRRPIDPVQMFILLTVMLNRKNISGTMRWNADPYFISIGGGEANITDGILQTSWIAVRK